MRVSFKTVGCRLNQAETATMAGEFLARGHEIVAFGQPCDVCVIHGCAVTSRALRDTIRLARLAKLRIKATRVVIAGCPVEVERETLEQESVADLLVDQRGKPNLAAWLDNASKPREPDGTALPYFARTRALVKVQDGCDFKCSYCVVPAARGTARSRLSGQIVDECRRLADKGFKEVVLTGANLGRYNDGGHGLCELITEIEKISGLRRIRLSSIELTTVERTVIDIMAQSEKLCRHLHVPLQSGDDLILAAMGRRYSVAQYCSFVEYAFNRIPHLGLSTDIIVGFPGEDRAAFENTIRVVEAIPFSSLHVFPYSIRPGTPAASLSNRVPERTKHARVSEMLSLASGKRLAFAERFVGRPVSVLIEYIRNGSASGWTGEYVRAAVRGPDIHENDIISFCPSRATDGMLM